MLNTLESKPRFTIHRTEEGAPVAADSADLSTLAIAAAIHCDDWATVDGFVKLTGGSTPTISLVPLMAVRYANLAGTEVNEYIVMGDAIGPLSDGDSFSIDVARGRLFARVSAVTGAPTAVQVLLAGAALDSRGER